MTAERILEELGSRAGARPHSIGLLLEAARIPNPAVIGFAAEQLARMLRICPWVALHTGLPPASPLIHQLEKIAFSAPQGQRLVFGGQAPEFFVFGDGIHRLSTSLTNLVGLLTLMRLSISAEIGTGFTTTQMRRIEALIRDHLRRPVRRTHWSLFSALDDRLSLATLADRLRSSIKSNTDAPQAEREITETLATWISDFLRYREAQLRRRLQIRGQDLLADVDWLDPEQGDDEPAPAPTPLAPMPGAEGLSDEYCSALATQSTRTRNTSFQKVHAEVLLDDQVSGIIARGFSKLADRGIEIGDKPKWILTLLTAATGRLYGFLPRIRLGEVGTYTSGEPYLDLSTGILHLPKLAPANIHSPDPGDSRYVFAENALPLPLPPVLVKLIHQYWQQHPVGCIGDWLQGRDPERLIRQCLIQFNDKPLHTREPAALRKWLSCQLFEQRQDLVALMVICGDTFGLSDAPLYYYSPRSKDLIKHYVEAIWPMFRRGLTVVDEPNIDAVWEATHRAGAAAVVRQEVVKAGFDDLSGQLNVSKIKALGTLDGLVSYHRAYTDYVARRLALVTTHRPNCSLYTLCRSHLSLSAHLAILQDKKVDPEHFTRATAITPAVSELIGDYLLHLRYLADHPMASATAREYLLAVCSGKHPLLVYLDPAQPHFQARPGSLDDWELRTPAPWSGLRTNFHRRFVLNALRECEPSVRHFDKGRLSAIILAQGGHLDAAGHPFDEDAVIAPRDLLHTLQPALQAMEHSLKLRRAKGFSDQLSAEQLAGFHEEVLSPPPLRDWASDLADHDATRKQLQRDQSEKLKSKLRSVARQAEQWLDDELPLVVPELVPVLKAAMKSNHKAAAVELRNVVISDLEMLELQERIADLGGADKSLTALQVATHNMLSNRLRVARNRLGLQCMRIDRYRLRYGREISPFLCNNLVAVEQMNALRTHLQNQLRQSSTAIAKPIEVAWALAVYDSQLSQDDIFALATGRVVAQHLPGRAGVLIAVRPTCGSILTLTGMAALVLGRYTAEELSAASRAIRSAVDLGQLMHDCCPQSLRPDDASSFLDLLLLTSKIAARVEQAPLLRTAPELDQQPHTDLSALAGFHSRTIPAGATNNAPSSASFEVDPDQAIERRETAVATAPSKDLRCKYLRLLHAVRDPRGFLKGAARENDSGVVSTLASSGEIRQALLLVSEKATQARHSASTLGLVEALTSFAGFLNDRDARGESPLAQVSVWTYLKDLGPVLLETLATADLRGLAEEDFDEVYRLVGEVFRQRKNAQRARTQLREFHDHLVREFGLAEATIQSVRSSVGDSLGTAKRQLLSDAHYDAAIGWVLRQLERTDIDGLRYGRWRRALLNAGVVTVLLRRGGLRINECLWLRYRDVFELGGRWYVSVVPSRFRTLKTGAARRFIRLDFKNDSLGQSLLQRWVEAEGLRGAGGNGGKDLFLPHLDHQRSSLGDDAMRRLIQMAFRLSCEIEMTPHELRHLFATDRWTQVITTGLGGTSPSMLVRRLDAIRVETGHASLTTTRDHYIHHLGLLKLQSVCSPSHLNTLRPILESLSTVDVATLDKAWQRTKAEQHVCWDHESERLRLAVARQQGAQRIKPDHGQLHELSAIPVLSRRPGFTLHVMDSWLRSVSTSDEFEMMGYGIGMDRVTIELGLDGIQALADSSARYRLLKSLTRRDRIDLVPRPRLYHATLDAVMLEAIGEKWLGIVERLATESIRPALLRQGVLRKPSEPSLHNGLNRILDALPKDCELSGTSSHHLRFFLASRQRSLTPQIAWNLAVAAVASRVMARN